ncbi:MAG: hypothetical protein MJA82_11950 [Clostridia bacterium]|nr:hypothetical protein [Clostridia bacterium]
MVIIFKAFRKRKTKRLFQVDKLKDQLEKFKSDLNKHLIEQEVLEIISKRGEKFYLLSYIKLDDTRQIFIIDKELGEIQDTIYEINRESNICKIVDLKPFFFNSERDKERFYRQGIGSEILNYIEKDSKQNNISQIIANLKQTHLDEGVMRFYMKNDFEIIDGYTVKKNLC